ncbi:MAG: hypothetical protein RLZZ621_809, partial [Gemmatimonadota bacterium]
EASAQVGGAIRTTHADGFLAEHGPNAFVTSSIVEALLEQLDLTDDVIDADPAAHQRFVVRNATPLPFPITPSAMLSTRLLSMRAKLRVLLEPLVRARRQDGDESVASFIRRRLGHEVLEYAVDPFISGIFAGDAEALSMAHAFPRVMELERRYGSLSRGLMAQRRLGRNAASAEHDPIDAPGSGGPLQGAVAGRTRLVSFVDGMQTLPDALAAAMPGVLRTSCPVRLVHRQESRWAVEAGSESSPETRLVDAVVMATPAHVLAAMELPAELRGSAAPLEQVDYPAVSTLTMGFRREDVRHALDGFGMLVPSAEHRSVLGALFSSSLFPGRAPEDHVALTCFIGGARHPDRAREDTDLLVERVLVDLRQLLGVCGEPVFVHHVFWPRGIPQYAVGHQEIKDAADDTERQHPGLYLAGNFRHGVSVGDCIASGFQVAERVATYLARTN